MMIKNGFVVCALVCFSGVLYAQNAGRLDFDFDADGKVTTLVNGNRNIIQSVEMTSDEKIIAAGQAQNNSDHRARVVRYNRDGSLDLSFSGDGITDGPAGDNFINGAAVVQSSGRVVLAGYGGCSPGWQHHAVRFNLNGLVDNTFGDNCYDLTTANDRMIDLALGPNGKFATTGYEDQTNQTLTAVFTADGALDPGFSSDGVVVTKHGGSSVANAIIFHPNGKVIVGGSTNNGQIRCSIIRYNTDGTLDQTFSGGGIVQTTFNGGADDSEILGLAVQEDGKILTVGYTGLLNGNNRIGVARYLDNGMRDETFGVDGTVTTVIGGQQDIGRAIALQKDGKIIVVGSTLDTGDGREDLVVLRYNTNGTLDKNFAVDGIFITDFFSAGNSSANAVTIQEDDRIVVAGSADDGTNTYFALARLHAGDVYPLAVEEQSHSNPWQAFPNPTSDLLTVRFDQKPKEQASLTVFNQLGQAVSQSSSRSQSTTIDLEAQPSGIYFLKVVVGSESYTRKVIIN